MILTSVIRMHCRFSSGFQLKGSACAPLAQRLIAKLSSSFCAPLRLLPNACLTANKRFFTDTCKNTSSAFSSSSSNEYCQQQHPCWLPSSCEECQRRYRRCYYRCHQQHVLGCCCADRQPARHNGNHHTGKVSLQHRPCCCSSCTCHLKHRVTATQGAVLQDLINSVLKPLQQQ